MPTTRDSLGRLCLGGMPLSAAVQDPRVGTPSYVYDLDGIGRGAQDLDAAFEGAPHLIAYAVKANSAGPIVRTLARAGCGADVVSGGEILLALACGIIPEKIVFSGVAKSDADIDLAVGLGDSGIGAIQVESVEEVARVSARASVAGRRVRVSIRINPGIDEEALGTHKHIATGHDEAKFGVAVSDAARAIEAVAGSANLELVGLTCHVGSQLTDVAPYIAAARILFGLAARAKADARVKLAFVDPGGGFGIDYGAGCPVKPADFVRAARAEQRAQNLQDLALHVEPGRALVAPHGVLVSRVLQTKKGAGGQSWLMIDAGMNDLLRPALYQARHRIEPLSSPTKDAVAWRVVGPVCESSDDFGVHDLPAEPDTLVAILDAGAYGYTMASQYNGRALPGEVFLAGGAVVAKLEREPVATWVRERAEIGQ